MTTLAEVLQFCSTANTAQRAQIINALAGGHFQNGPLPHEADEYGHKSHLVKRAEAVVKVKSAIDIGDEVKFLYNGVNYIGQVVKMLPKNVKVRIMSMDGDPTRRGVTVGAVVSVGATLIARNL